MASFKRKMVFVSLLAAGAASTSVFQNCAPKNFSIEVRTPSSDGKLDCDPQDPSCVSGPVNPDDPGVIPEDQTNPPVPPAPKPIYKVEMSAATRTIPPLKLFFIVDNSYTMKVNQDHLAESFDAMFGGANATSLKPFNTEVYLFNTAQRSIPTADKTATGWSERPEMTSLLGVQQSVASLESLLLADLLAAHRGSVLSGGISGDTIGYSVSKTNEGAIKYAFKPAPVLGFQSKNGVVKSALNISKAANEDPGQMVAEFKDRLKVLDASRDPRLQPTVSDNESGLCALSRIVRDNQGLVSSGDIASFVLVSDENDADEVGESCLRSVTHFNDGTDLIDGRCEKRTTSFGYHTSSKKCKVSSVNRYNFRYFYEHTRLRYVAKDVNKCVLPRHNINFYSSSLKRQQTTINYKLKVCPSEDGVVVESKCSLVNAASPMIVQGDVTATCGAEAVARNPLALDPVCSLSKVVDPTCSVEQSTCVREWGSLTSVAMDGPVPADCAAAAASASIVFDADHPVTCALRSANEEISGACTQAQKDVGGHPTYFAKEISLIGQASMEICQAKAAERADFYQFDSNDQNNCLVRQAGTEGPYISGQITVSNGIEGNQATNSATCLSGVRQAVLSEVQKKSPSVTDNGLCTITGTQFASDLVRDLVDNKVQSGGASSVDTGLSCSDYAASYCANSNGNNVKCSGSIFDDYKYNTHTSVAEGLSCDTKCSASEFSKLACGGPAYVEADANLSIQEYLIQKKGAIPAKVYSGGWKTSCSASVAPSSPVSRLAVVNTDAAKALACEPVNGEPRYFVPTGSVYRSNLNKAVELVRNQDSADLPSYIFSRSTELFGEQLPFVSVFVNQTQEEVGNGGSVGEAYSRLAALMNGNEYKVSLQDYSPALSSLSTEIKKRMDRSFQISAMAGDQKVIKVWHKPSGAQNYTELAVGKWSSSGNTVTISNDVPMDLGDSFRFEYQ